MLEPEPLQIPIPNQRVTLREIESAICTRWPYLTREILESPQRRRSVARPRQIAYYLARQITPLSLPQIGRRFNRDHSTILHGVRRVAALVESNPLVRDHVETVAGILAAQRMGA